MKLVPKKDCYTFHEMLSFSAMKNGWIIKTPEKSFAVYAATPTEKKEWMSHIERCVTDLLEKGSLWSKDGPAGDGSGLQARQAV